MKNDYSASGEKLSLLDKFPLPLKLLWAACFFGSFILFFPMMMFPSILLAVIEIVCILFGTIPVIISCLQIMEKKDIDDLKLQLTSRRYKGTGWRTTTCCCDCGSEVCLDK